jgi:hypothetical protein
MAFRKWGIFMLGLGVVVGSARATTTFSTVAAFNTAAALAGLAVGPTITFTGDTDITNITTLTDSSVVFTSGDMNVELISGWPDGNVIGAGTGAGSISIAPPTTYYAFGFSIVTVSGAAYPLDVTFNDGTSHDFSVTSSGSMGNAVFFGDISTAPVTTLEVSTNFNGLIFGVDDVQIGSQSAQSGTPEGPTNLLIGSGLTALYWLHRRRRQPLLV